MKEVIILGKAPSGRWCPFDAEVWGINDACLHSNFEGRHFDRVIVGDALAGEWSQEVIDRIKSLGIPIIGFHDYADEQYPMQEVEGYFNSKYLRNTVSRAIALALYWGYKKIRLYGVDQEYPEYQLARACVEYWIGRAHGMGVILTVQKESHLLRILRPQP